MSVIPIERRGAAAWLTIGRPEARNALSRAVVDGLRAALRDAVADPAVRAVVVTGAGDQAFCAGADLKERRGLSLDEARVFVRDLNALMDELEALPKLTVAAMQGSAYGGGIELALCCDLRVGVEGAEYGLTEVRLGIMPGAGGTQRLPRLLGLARAKEIILLGKRFPARRAQELGLLHQVVERGALAPAVDAYVADVAECAPISVAQAKTAMQGGWHLPMTDALALERACYEVTLGTEDRNEALAAFAEKRKPHFKGR